MPVPDLYALAQRQKALLAEALQNHQSLPPAEREARLRELFANAEALEAAAAAGTVELEVTPSAMRASRQAAARMEAVVNNLSAGVLVSDPQGVVQLANAYAEAVFGFDPVGITRELLFRRVTVTDDDGERLYAESLPAAQAAAGEIVMNRPLTLVNSYGRSYRVLVSAMPIYIGREYQGVVAVWNDITGQELLLSERRQQRDLLEAIFATNPGGLALISLDDMVYQMANDAYQAVTPQPALALVGRTVAEVWSAEEQERLRAHYLALAPGELAHLPLQIPQPDGTARFFETVARPIRWQEQDAVLVVIWEVTRLERALEEAQEGRRILQALMDYVPEGITIADAPDVNIRMVSKYGQQLVGRPNEELSGIPAAEHPERWQVYTADGAELVPADRLPLSRATLSGEVIENEELQMRRADGQIITILCNAGPIRDAQGALTGGIIAWRDISERKQVEEALAESEERFRMLADHMSQLAWMAEPDGAIFWYNQRWFEYTGTSLETVAGWGWRAIHHPDHEARVTEKYLRCIADAKVWEDTFPLRGADGQYRWFLSRAVPICGEDGQVVRWFGTNTDITALRAAQEAVRESEQRFRVALGPVPIMVFTMDRDLRYTWMFAPHQNLQEPNAVGLRDEDIFPPESVAELQAAKRRALASGQPYQGEVVMPIGGETWTYILTLDPLVDERGAVTGLVGAALDVTEQRRLQARQRELDTDTEVQRRLLEHRELERQEIARDIHDGPIQSMVSTLFSLQYARDSLEDTQARDMIGQMMALLKVNVAELREVINQLRPPVLIRFGLARAIEIHAEDMRARHQQLTIHLDLHNDEGLLPEMTCLALYRVYQEAFNNIVRHAQASQVWVRYFLAGDRLLLEIRDDGSGFQEPSDWLAYTRQNHFGLAGMRERVLAVGGQLELGSQPGEGTWVRVVLGLAPGEAPGGNGDGPSGRGLSAGPA